MFGGAGFMKMSEFESLFRKEQIIILYQDGVYIGKKKAGTLTKMLFQLESFYVELVYTKYRRTIHKMRCSDSTIILEPYLDQITVEDLVT
jgi:hypothetical protein